MGRGLIIILVASLALNVFAVGFFSGRVINNEGLLMRSGPMQSGRIDNPFALMQFARELPPEIRDGFRSKIRGELPTMREKHRETQKLQGELAVLIASEEWDRAAVTAKLAEIKTVQDHQRDVFGAAFVDALETLPAAERKKLIENARHRERERRPPRDRRRPREDNSE